MKAWPIHDIDEDVWNVYVEVDKEVMPVGTIVDYVGTVPIFENAKFETREKTIEYIDNSEKLELNLNWLDENMFKCNKCGLRMTKESLGAEAPCDEEWLECECGHTRELTTKEIDYDLEMRY